MGPFKCPDCGVWWAGFEHRCQLDFTRVVQPPKMPDATITTTTVRCTCPPNRGDNYFGRCPIHDVTVSYTSSAQGDH